MKIGSIGLGIMGSRMAANLQKNGYSLVVFNRTRAKAEPLLGPCGTFSDSPAKLAEQVDVLFTMLAHPGAVSRGWRIPDEAIAELAAAGLAGLETDHPDHDPAERERLRGLAAGLGLLTTGGSDDHGSLTGHRLGAETTSPEAFEQLMARCPPPA